MKKYFVNIEECLHPNYPTPPYKGKYFKIFFKNLRRKTKEKFGLICVDSRPSKHLLIEARSFTKAKEVTDLIYACSTLIQGWEIFDSNGFKIKEIKNDYKILPGIWCCSASNHSFQLASFMAAKASFRNEYIYSILKLFYSFFIYSVPTIDLDPFHSGVLEKPTINKPLPPSEVIRMTTAINLAYSAMEELNFDVSSNARNQSGNWSSEAEKNKLEKSLKKRKINTKELYIWDLRGKKTFLEKSMPKRKFVKAKWSKFDIRDEEIDVIDAIANASVLRSQVCAHMFTKDRYVSSKEKLKKIKTLSVYDVTNIQHLARRLILESLGLWRIKERLLKS